MGEGVVVREWRIHEWKGEGTSGETRGRLGRRNARERVSEDSESTVPLWQVLPHVFLFFDLKSMTCQTLIQLYYSDTKTKSKSGLVNRSLMARI